MKVFLSAFVLFVNLRRGWCVCVNPEPLLNQGLITINRTCGNASGTIYTNNTDGNLPYMYIKSGHLGPDNMCTVYDRTESGQIIGRFTGNGISEGAVKGISDQMYYFCNLSQPHGDVEISFQIALFEDCGGSFEGAVEEIITSPTLPGSSDYPHCALCRWEFTHNTSCNYSLRLLDTTLAQGDFIYFNFGGEESNETIGSPDRFGSLSGSITDNFHSWRFGTRKLRIEFVSDSVGTDSLGFGLSVKSDCGNVCGEVVILKLTNTDLKDLNATSGDTLLVSSDGNALPDDVADECKVDFSVGNFTFNLTSCDPIITQTSDELTVTHIVRKANILNESNPIQRYFKFHKNFTCVLPRDVNLTATVVKPEIKKVGVASDPVSGDFNIAFHLHDNEHFNSTPLEVAVPNYVYAEIRLSDVPQSNTNFIMQMTGCWATLGETPSSEPSYPIIDASCESNNAFENSDNIAILRNHEAIYGRFKFKSFVWTNVSDADQRIYVHCDVNVCDSDVTGSDCSQPSCGRKRREVGGGRTLSAGPVVIASLRHQHHYVTDDVNEVEDPLPFILVVFLIAALCAIVYLIRN